MSLVTSGRDLDFVSVFEIVALGEVDLIGVRVIEGLFFPGLALFDLDN